MYASNTQATNGDTLVHVTFERENPLTSAPTIEVVLKVEDGGSMIMHSTKVLVLLSCTVTDTREPIILTEGERKLVYEKAAEHVAEEDL
jgi:hypothetical protein